MEEPEITTGRRPRSAVRVPMYDLESSIDVARRLHERGGGTAAAEALAAYLNYSGTHNGSFINRISAARMFGLIEGPGQKLETTPRARHILMPDYPDVEAQARLDAFFDVDLYSEFFKEYGGRQLPPKEGMINALVNKFGVAGKQAPNVLARLLDSADQAGLFSIAGARTKLIRPSIGAGRDHALDDGQPREPDGFDEPRQQQAQQAFGHVSEEQPHRYPKLIEGALEQLPNPAGERRWTEQQMNDWLELFKLALKVVYPPVRANPTEEVMK